LGDCRRSLGRRLPPRTPLSYPCSQPMAFRAQEKWYPYPAKGYPCPMRYLRIPTLIAHGGSLPKRGLIREHPCLYKSGIYRPAICHHRTCGSKAHQDGYECPCPAGNVIYVPATALLRREEMFHEHPCTLLDGELARLLNKQMCRHTSCAIAAHEKGYQCQQTVK